MSRHNQKGFAALETTLILAIVAIVGGTGYYVWHAKQNANSNLAISFKTTNVNKGQISPIVFSKRVLKTLEGSDETTLNSELTHSFAAYRKQSLDTTCKGQTIKDPMVMFCGAQLDPSAVIDSTPEVSEYVFKDGQKGKSVTYKLVQKKGDAGATYYSFKLIAHKNSWLVNDYGDLFVGVNDSAPGQISGAQEEGL